jgi:membrane protein DedA with SNARE-associated domain
VGLFGTETASGGLPKRGYFAKAIDGCSALFGHHGGIARSLLMEAGVPIPVPIDLVLLVIGERTAALHVPLLVTAGAIEVVAVIGTAALFFGAVGPAAAVIDKAGARLGLTRRLPAARAFVERRGRPALVAGRATPGLRTATVVAAAFAGLKPARALPALVAGSTLFLQAHLVLGYFLGPAVLQAFSGAALPVLAALAVLAALGLLIWARRRGARGLRDWTEAACPVCVAITLVGGDVRLTREET